MRIRVQRHIGRLPVRYFDSNKTGVLVSRVMSDVEGVRNLVGTGLVEFIGGLFTAVLAFSFLIRINVDADNFCADLHGLFSAVIIRMAFGKVRPMFRERNRINAEVTGRLTESFGGVRVVKGFHGEERESREFSKGAYQLFEQVRQTHDGAGQDGTGVNAADGSRQPHRHDRRWTDSGARGYESR